MTNYDWGGWIILGNGTDTYKIICQEQPEYGFEDPSAVHYDYPGDGHGGFTLDTRKRVVVIKSIIFITTARLNQFMAFLEAAQAIGLTLKIQITTAGAFWDFDGTAGNDVMPVMWDKPRGIKKLFGGNTTIWEIAQITFRQKGALS